MKRVDMNCITYALGKLRYAIPRQILEKAFTPYVPYQGMTPQSIDNQIETLVIKPLDLKDCQITQALQAFVDLSNLEFISDSPYEKVIHIPKDRTNGRSILSPISVSHVTSMGTQFATGGLPSYFGGQPSAMNIAMSNLLASQAAVPNMSSSSVRLVGENVISIAFNGTWGLGMGLYCWLEGDTNLTHILPASYRSFARLVELAVKAHIYNQEIILMDEAFIKGGSDLGRMTQIVEGWSDAYEQYNDYLKDVWAKTAFLNDPTSRKRLVNSLVGPGR